MLCSNKTRHGQVDVGFECLVLVWQLCWWQVSTPPEKQEDNEDARKEVSRAAARGFVAVMLLQCYSRGRVAIEARDPLAMPRVQENMLADPGDLVRMRFGYVATFAVSFVALGANYRCKRASHDDQPRLRSECRPVLNPGQTQLSVPAGSPISLLRTRECCQRSKAG